MKINNFQEAFVKVLETDKDPVRGAEVVAAEDQLRAYFALSGARPERLDEFDQVSIETARDIADRFVPNFFFGCEADDPLAAWAFASETNPFGARLQAMLGSDISHWDVTNMVEPIAEAHELVERGALDPADFRDFAFANAVRLHAGMNPDFFVGTVVEREAAAVLAEEGT